jgi:hypothetical protein
MIIKGEIYPKTGPISFKMPKPFIVLDAKTVNPE